jgi:hypothetical protein
LSETHVGAPLAVTTSGKADERVLEVAREFALGCGLPFVQRRKKEPLRPLLEAVCPLLVFGVDGVALCDREGKLRYSPGMARLRIKRLDAQVREDRLVELAGFRCGDRVLDCTLGLAADALVAAHVVGPSGKVIGLEKSLAIFALVAAGVGAFKAARASPIDVRHEDAGDFLSRQRDKSFDLILFDPMFDRPGKFSPAFQMLRRYAEHAPLSPRTLAEAQRVARRAVLVKGPPRSREWTRLQLTPERGSPYAATSWVRLPGL